jgi:protein-S-isoprenylcysteine O-methyltransferase Ste14
VTRQTRTPRGKAAAGSLLFLLVAPGVVAGLVPWAITGWRVETDFTAARAAGAILIAVGAGFLLHAFTRFVLEGVGTPAPVAPPTRLVVGGAYRYVRNPMYLALEALIVGQALFFGQPVLLAWGAAIGIAVFTFVRLYEEPTLARQFGRSYEAYRRGVPGWIPRLTPWSGRESAMEPSLQRDDSPVERADHRLEPRT